MKRIDAMKKNKKPNGNSCMEEHLTILKQLREKHIMVMNKNLEIYGTWRHKITSQQFFLSSDDTA